MTSEAAPVTRPRVALYFGGLAGSDRPEVVKAGRVHGEVVAVFDPCSMSKSSGALNELLIAACAQKFDVLVLSSVTQLGPFPAALAAVLRLSGELGVQVVSVRPDEAHWLELSSGTQSLAAWVVTQEKERKALRRRADGRRGGRPRRVIPEADLKQASEMLAAGATMPHVSKVLGAVPESTLRRALSEYRARHLVTELPHPVGSPVTTIAEAA